MAKITFLDKVLEKITGHYTSKTKNALMKEYIEEEARLRTEMLSKLAEEEKKAAEAKKVEEAVKKVEKIKAEAKPQTGKKSAPKKTK